MLTAARQLERQNKQIKTQRERAKRAGEDFVAGGGVLAGGPIAALIDEYGAGNEDQAEWKGIPVNAALAATAVLTGALVRGLPLRRGVVGVGLGIGACALYNLTRENVDFTDDD